MRWGIGSYTWAWAVGVPGYDAPERPLSAEALIPRAARNGLRSVQFCDNLPLSDLTPSALDRLVGAVDESGIEIQIGARGLDPEYLKEQLALAVRVDSPFLRLVIDRAGDEPTPQEAVARLKPLIPAFVDAGVVLAIENHDRFSAPTLARMVEELGPGDVGICLDTVNSFGALEGPEATIAALRPYTVHLHVKDFTIARLDHQMGFKIEGAPAGAGRLDVPWLIETLPAGISATLEHWAPWQGSTAATVALEEAWAEQSIAYLKTVLG